MAGIPITIPPATILHANISNFGGLETFAETNRTYALEENAMAILQPDFHPTSQAIEKATEYEQTDGDEGDQKAPKKNK